jgi:hypothetical protein
MITRKQKRINSTNDLRKKVFRPKHTRTKTGITIEPDVSIGTNELRIGDVLPGEVLAEIVQWLDPLSLWMCSQFSAAFRGVCTREIGNLRCLNGMIPPVNILAQHVLASRDLCKWLKNEPKHTELVMYYLDKTGYPLQPIDLLYVVRSGNTDLYHSIRKARPGWTIPFYFTNALSAAVQSGNTFMLFVVHADVLGIHDANDEFPLSDAIATRTPEDFDEYFHMSPFALPLDYGKNTNNKRETPDFCGVPTVGYTTRFHWCFARKLVHLTEEEVNAMVNYYHVGLTHKSHLAINRRLYDQSITFRLLHYWKIQYMIDTGKHRSVNTTTIENVLGSGDMRSDRLERLVEDMIVYSGYWAPRETKEDAIRWAISLCNEGALSVYDIHECAWATGDPSILRTVVETDSEWGREMKSFIQEQWFGNSGRHLDTMERNREELVGYIRTLTQPEEDLIPIYNIRPVFPTHFDLRGSKPQGRTKRAKGVSTREKKLLQKKITKSKLKRDIQNVLRTVDCCNECEVLNGNQITYADPVWTPKDILERIGVTSRNFACSSVPRIPELGVLLTMVYKRCTVPQLKKALQKIHSVGKLGSPGPVILTGATLLFSREDLFDTLTSEDSPLNFEMFDPLECMDYLFHMAFFSGNTRMVHILTSFYMRDSTSIRITVSPAVFDVCWWYDCQSEHLYMTKDENGHTVMELGDDCQKVRGRTRDRNGWKDRDD